MERDKMNHHSLSSDMSEILFSPEALDVIVEKLANQITDKYKEKVLEKNEKLVILAVLNGSFQFVSDLVKKIDLPIQIEFMFASSYGKSTVSSGDINIKVGKNQEVLEDPETNIVIVEDIVDSGFTLHNLLDYLKTYKPRSLKICALIDKPHRRTNDVKSDYVGFVMEKNEFIVGYGLDYAHKYRNFPYIGVLKEEVYS